MDTKEIPAKRPLSSCEDPNRTGSMVPYKVAIVTGALTGIGLGCAIELIAQGYHVTLAGLPSDADKYPELNLSPITSSFTACDVTSETEVHQLVQNVHFMHGRLDAVVLSAGICKASGPLHNETTEGMMSHFNVNVMGCFYGIAAAAPIMAAQPSGGSIVAMCSVAGLRGHPGLVAYGTSKWALQGLVRCAAADYGSSKVRINAVAPGPVDTGMLPAILGGVGGREGAAAMAKLNRIGTVEDVSKAVMCLISSDFLTGVIMPVDGGYMA